MTKHTAWAIPVLPGKTEQLRQYMNELKGPRRQETIEFSKKYNLFRERDFLQQTPQGDFFIMVWEGEDLEKFMNESSKNPDEYTKWNMKQMQEITGLEPPTDDTPQQEWPLPQVVCETELSVPENAGFVAFAAPVLPGKTEQVKQFASQLSGERKQEFNESRSKRNVRERTYLQESPEGSIVIITLEGENPENFFREFVKGTDEFTKWFAQQVKEIHGVELTEVAQAPAPELLYDTEQLVKESALAS